MVLQRITREVGIISMVDDLAPWLHVTCICPYVPQTGRSAEEKDSFWDQMISVTGSIPASELIVVGLAEMRRKAMGLHL